MFKRKLEGQYGFTSDIYLLPTVAIWEQGIDFMFLKFHFAIAIINR